MISASMVDLVSWRECGPSVAPWSLLNGHVDVFGIKYLAVAVAVEHYDVFHQITGEVVGKGQRGSSSLADVELIKWNRATGVDLPYPTLYIRERPYVIFLRPSVR